MRTRLLLSLVFFSFISQPTVGQEQYQKWLQYLEGTWMCEMENGETGLCQFTRPPGNNGLTLSASTETFTITGVIGWDPKDESMRETVFSVEKGDAACQERYYNTITEDTIQGTGKPFGSENPAMSEKLVYERVSENEMALRGTGFAGSGNWTVKFTRDTPAAHMASLAPLIGTWKHESEAEEEFGPVSPGDKVKLTSKFSWKIDKHAVLLEWTYQINDQDPVHGIELLGWDKQTRSIRGIMQTTNGAQDSGSWTCDGETLSWTGAGVDVVGQPTNGTVHFVAKGDDRMTWQSVNQTVNGASIPDSNVYEYQKVD